MKVIVSNFGRQYSNELLVALQEAGWLERFFTALASNKVARPAGDGRLFQAWRKRYFPRIQDEKIRHFPLLFLLERLLRNRWPAGGRLAGDLFDRLVAMQLRPGSCDMVISYENTNRATMAAARRLGKTAVLDLAQIHHGDIVRYGKWFMTDKQLRDEVDIINIRKAEALAHTDYVITLSSFAAESMLRHGWPQDRLFTVNLGIDPRRFTVKREYRKNGPLQLLFVGTITRRKGLTVLFDALSGLPEEAFELTIIGPMADAHDLITAHTGRFRYHPFLHHEALVHHYQQADLFVFPSLLDSWAQTVLEAMACGTPAIVTENTGSKDAVRLGGGWVIPPNDPVALRDCIRFCMENREVLEAEGRLAHSTAQRYTWEAYHRQLIQTLEEIQQREARRLRPDNTSTIPPFH